MLERPVPEEYSGFNPAYVARVPEGTDIFALLASQAADVRAAVCAYSDQTAGVRPDPGEWSVKEVIGHICDTERVFAYRALRIARGDATPLPGFDQDAYVAATDLNARPLAELLEEFELQRRANVLCFARIAHEELARFGVVNDRPATARAILFTMAGHVLHHLESLLTDYAVPGAH